MFKLNVCKIPATHCCVFEALRDYNSQCTFETGPGGAQCHMTPGGPVGYVTGGTIPPPFQANNDFNISPSPKYSLTNIITILKVIGMQVRGELQTQIVSPQFCN